MPFGLANAPALYLRLLNLLCLKHAELTLFLCIFNGIFFSKVMEEHGLNVGNVCFDKPLYITNEKTAKTEFISSSKR